MAKAPANFSLKDQYFNAESLTELAGAYARAVPGIDAGGLAKRFVSGVAERSLLACLDWFADCLEPYLAPAFPDMAAQLEAAMPPPLDPSRSDDDFGRFIHAVPGVLAVRHGLEVRHRARAFELLLAATQRFSMEFYIRPFLNQWPEETLHQLGLWAAHDNYHVRRLVSEGTRPKLPWAMAIALSPAQTVPLLDQLHADPTRYVTRSVANHLNDLSKTDPDLVLEMLAKWRAEGRQQPKELDWMTRHSLRTLIKQGHPGAMAHLGYDRDADVAIELTLETPAPKIGAALVFAVTVQADVPTPILVDYRIGFARPNGRTGEKVYKFKVTEAGPTPKTLIKRHALKANATTFELHPGRHSLTVQINGVDRAQTAFDLLRP